jgi:DNA adenine methylase
MLSSPLRYPGGKAKLFPYFAEVVSENRLFCSTYCEPYAGGAGLALRLLSSGFVSRIALNDIDEAIYCFWKAVLEQPGAFCELIVNVPLTIDEWHRQREIWGAKDMDNVLELGFSAFYLNRTNRSGIIEGAGPIGGYHQQGPWTLDVRFNRKQLASLVKELAGSSHLITVTNEDALDFAARQFEDPETFSYLDPPYYVKGSKLYRNFYEHEDHCEILGLLERSRTARWVVSYDDVPEIRKIYSRFSPVTYSLSYSAGQKGTGSEVIYFSDALSPPVVDGFRTVAA